MSDGSKSIVLLGIGHTNAYVVKQWASKPISGCTLTCISKFPTATYSGMLPGTLGGQFREDEMRIDLSELARRAGAKLILADTCGLDLQNGRVQFCDHEDVPFDALSIGVGSMPAQWDQHVASPIIVPIKPMQTFLERLEEHLRSNAPRSVAIVGGGVASVEVAFCLQEQFAKRQIDDTAVVIYTSSEHVGEGMTDRSVRKIEKLLASRRISVHAGHRVTSVGETGIELDDGSQHPADIVIWATGAAAPPVLSSLGLKTDARGFVATSKTLQSLSDARIFAVGDSGTVLQSPSPKAGVYAVRQCPVLWHNLCSLVEGGAMIEFAPQRDFLKLLNTGDGKALLQYGRFTAHARWCWQLKTWIDRRFIREFQSAK